MSGSSRFDGVDFGIDAKNPQTISGFLTSLADLLSVDEDLRRRILADELKKPEITHHGRIGDCESAKDVSGFVSQLYACVVKGCFPDQFTSTTKNIVYNEILQHIDINGTLAGEDRWT
ncbi:unnamed protein product [Cuscuta campestris]|uniref:Uncharacterized protein n=1 Tax=Cuscuta campestris TaxID=132261 RepID=A0A484N178_9ASTE|nr:unnamed protein product [Cuscuta campestris]